METTEDDMIVLVVVDDDEKSRGSEKEVKEPDSEPASESNDQVDNILEIAQKHGEYVSVKLDSEDECDYEYLEDETATETDIKEEATDGMELCEGDPEYIPEESQQHGRRDKRFTMLKPWQQRSFVAELRENHEELREDPEFPCSLCSAVFITKSNLKSHENLHRGERPYRCHACPCAYASNSALSVLVRKYGCDECDRRFAQKCALNLHVYRVHRNLPPPCPCQICPKRFQRMSLLKEHMKRQHGMSIITRKNGEVLKMERGGTEVLFEIESAVDGQIFIKTLNDNDSSFEGDCSDLSTL
ncbi:hypothetical protein HF086_011353, partial [Spodoptera exigua]